VAGSSAVQMVLLFVGLRRRLGTLRGGELVPSILRIGTASAIAGVAAWSAARVAKEIDVAQGSDGAFARALPGIAGGAVFVAMFLALAWGLGARELGELSAPIRRRLGRARA